MRSASRELDPTLSLAVMAIDSGFTRSHQAPWAPRPDSGHDRCATRTSTRTWLQPRVLATAVTNLRVGVKVLQECIQRAWVAGACRRASSFISAAATCATTAAIRQGDADHALLKLVATAGPCPCHRPR